MSLIPRLNSLKVFSHLHYATKKKKKAGEDPENKAMLQHHIAIHIPQYITAKNT